MRSFFKINSSIFVLMITLLSSALWLLKFSNMTQVHSWSSNLLEEMITRVSGSTSDISNTVSVGGKFPTFVPSSKPQDSLVSLSELQEIETENFAEKQGIKTIELISYLPFICMYVCIHVMCMSLCCDRLVRRQQNFIQNGLIVAFTVFG